MRGRFISGPDFDFRPLGGKKGSMCLSSVSVFNLILYATTYVVIVESV